MRRAGVVAAWAAAVAMTIGPVAAAPAGAVDPPGAEVGPTVGSGMQAYFGNMAGFDAASGAPVQVTFDDVAAGTDIQGSAINGATFSAGPVEGAAPIVVRAADTTTPDGFTGPEPFDPADNTLVATTGDNVLSPGGTTLAPGPNPTVENDDLVVRFDQPVSAVGFDLLFQSLDDYSGVAVLLYDSSGSLLYVNGLIPAGTNPAGSPGAPFFVGFVSPSPNIATLVVDDTDDNEVWPDANIGFDSFRFGIGPPAVVPGGATVSEGDTGTVTLQVPVTLSRATAETVTVDWATVFDPAWGPAAAAPGVDYAPASGTVTFTPGETIATVQVAVVGDATVEPDELLVVAFVDATNARVGGFWGLGFGGIANDDLPPTVLPGSATVDEGDAGTSVLEIPVTLTSPSAVAVTLDWITTFDPAWGPAAAMPGVDYTAASGTVTFAPGETVQTVSVEVVGDLAAETDEVLAVSFRNPTNAVLGGYWGLGFGGIADDD